MWMTNALATEEIKSQLLPSKSLNDAAVLFTTIPILSTISAGQSETATGHSKANTEPTKQKSPPASQNPPSTEYFDPRECGELVGNAVGCIATYWIGDFDKEYCCSIFQQREKEGDLCNFCLKRVICATFASVILLRRFPSLLP
ncbi:hypothetical protein RHMOL_Rhmol08G0008500 [Rhododendron molle]|uniref:Uncharacterized protein n=1 Tax=Rhododendron molle TaxID=49168 RepID=A0ACC0MK57_RHOML|nr:hypothetical protein RHMOL_Rhmol08G0008500 [Rhododendron molle]